MVFCSTEYSEVLQCMSSLNLEYVSSNGRSCLFTYLFVTLLKEGRANTGKSDREKYFMHLAVSTLFFFFLFLLSFSQSVTLFCLDCLRSP